MPKKKRLKLWEGRKRFQDVRRREVQQQMSSETDAGNIELEPEHHSELKPTSLPREDELSQKELNPYSVPHIDVKSLEEDFDFSHTTVKEEAEDEYDKMGFEDPLMGDMSEVKEELGSGFDGSFKSEEIYIKEEPMEPMQEPSNKEERRGEKRRGHFRSQSPDLQSNKQRLKVEEDVNVKDGPKYDKSGVLLDWRTDIRWKWKSLRDSFRRKLATTKKEKSGSAQGSGRKEYIYFKHLSFRLPICETRPHPKEGAEDPTEERNTEKESQPLEPSIHQMKRKKPLLSVEQVLFQILAKKANAPDDPDKQFLLSLLPDLKCIPESAKLDVKVEFMNILQRYKQHPTIANQQYFPLQHNFSPGPGSPSHAPHNFSPNIMLSQSTAIQSQPMPPFTPSPTATQSHPIPPSTPSPTATQSHPIPPSTPSPALSTTS